MFETKVSFNGWFRWTNLGAAYRQWSFPNGVTVNGIEYLAGAMLRDAGIRPRPLKRFELEAKTAAESTASRVWFSNSERAAARILSFPVPPWPALPDVLPLLEREGASAKVRAQISTIVSSVTAPAVATTTDDEGLAWACSLKLPGFAFYARASVRGSRIKAGDVLRRYTADPCPGLARIPLLVSDYKALRAVAGSIADDFSYCGTSKYFDVSVLEDFARDSRGWHLRRKVWTPALYTLRRVTREPAGEPITASGDEAALFELITQAGGRLAAAPD